VSTKRQRFDTKGALYLLVEGKEGPVRLRVLSQRRPDRKENKEGR